MFGSPKNVDLGFLKGKELFQICIGQYQLQYHFDGDVSISTESEFIFYNKSIRHDLKSSPEAASIITALLGKSIVDFEIDAEGTLQIRFSNGDGLALFDDNRGYECYQITNAKTLIVV
jgi:hypothetical protein